MLCHFCLFLSCVLDVSKGPVATPAHGLLGLSLRLQFISVKASLLCFVYLCHRPRSHFTKFLTRALVIGPCQCSCIFVPCLAFWVTLQVT